MSWRLEKLYTRRFLFGAATGLGFLLVTYGGPPVLKWAFPPTTVAAGKGDKLGVTVVGKAQTDQQVAQLNAKADRVGWYAESYTDSYPPDSADSFRDRWPHSSTGRKPSGTQLAAKLVEAPSVWGDYYGYDTYVPDAPRKKRRSGHDNGTSDRARDVAGTDYYGGDYQRDVTDYYGRGYSYDYSYRIKPNKRSYIPRSVRTASYYDTSFAPRFEKRSSRDQRLANKYDYGSDTGSYGYGDYYPNKPERQRRSVYDNGVYGSNIVLVSNDSRDYGSYNSTPVNYGLYDSAPIKRL